jgi:hypothetical protein
MVPQVCSSHQPPKKQPQPFPDQQEILFPVAAEAAAASTRCSLPDRLPRAGVRLVNRAGEVKGKESAQRDTIFGMAGSLVKGIPVPRTAKKSAFRRQDRALASLPE